MPFVKGWRVSLYRKGLKVALLLMLKILVAARCRDVVVDR